MPVSGLVITLIPAPEKHGVILDALRAIDDLEVGPVADARVAVTLETDRDHRSRIQTIREVPGVVDVDVVFIAHDPLPTS